MESMDMQSTPSDLSDTSGVVDTRPNIFVIGHTGTGKSTVASRVAYLAGMKHMEAGGWARGLCPQDATTLTITEAAVTYLRTHPRMGSDRLLAGGLNDGDVIVSGVRNPGDFAVVFRPETDIVVFLTRVGYGPATAFDDGIAAIDAHARWLVDIGLLDRTRLMRESWGNCGGDDSAGVVWSIIATLASIRPVGT